MKALKFLFNININLKRKTNNIPINIDLAGLVSLVKIERNNYTIPNEDKEFFFKEALIDYLIYRNSTNFYIGYFNPISEEIKIDGHNNFLIQNSKVIKITDHKSIFESFSSADFYFFFLYLQAAMKYNKYLLTLNTEKYTPYSTKEIMKYTNNKEQLLIHLITKQEKINSFDELKHLSFLLMN